MADYIAPTNWKALKDGGKTKPKPKPLVLEDKFKIAAIIRDETKEVATTKVNVILEPYCRKVENKRGKAYVGMYRTMEATIKKLIMADDPEALALGATYGFCAKPTADVDAVLEDLAEKGGGNGPVNEPTNPEGKRQTR